MVEVGPFVPGRPTDIPFDEQDFSPTDSHELSDVPNEELEQRLGESSSVSQERLERHGKPVADSPSPFVPNAQVASAEGQRISQNNFQMQPFGDSVGPVVSVRSDLVSGHAGPDTPIDDLFFPKEAQLPGAIDESAEEEEDNPGNSHESFIAAKLQGSLNRSPVPKGSSPTFSKPEDKATGALEVRQKGPSKGDNEGCCEDVEPTRRCASPAGELASPRALTWKLLEAAKQRTTTAQVSDIDFSKYNARSLFLLTLGNPFRRVLIRMVSNKWFERFVLVVILANVGFMAAYDPVDSPVVNPSSPRRAVLEMADVVFSIFFAIECVSKIVALGFIVGEKTYLRDVWNVLDFIVVLLGVIDLLPSLSISSVLVLRTFRVLRPLRAISRFGELRFLVILLCIPHLVNVVCLIAFIFVVFGLVGVQLWQGKLRQRCYNVLSFGVMPNSPVCSLPFDAGMSLCPDGFECLSLSTNPLTVATSFDTIGDAMISVLQVMTFANWTDLMYRVQDTHSFYIFVYFVLLSVVGPFLSVQLFLVVISTKFTEAKAAITALVGPANKRASFIVRRLSRLGGSSVDVLMLHLQTPTDHSDGWLKVIKRLRLIIFRAVMSPRFTYTIMFVISANFVVLALEHDCEGQNYCPDFNLFQQYSSLVFTAFFCIELVLKVFCYGPKEYFLDKYNLLDVAVVVVSLIEVPQSLLSIRCSSGVRDVSLIDCDSGRSGIGAIRMLRILRLLALFKSFPALQRQLRLIVKSTASVASLIVLLGLFILIFAILGNSLFGAKLFHFPDEVPIVRGTLVNIALPSVDATYPAAVEDVFVAPSGEFLYNVSFRFAPPTQAAMTAAVSSLQSDSMPFIASVVPRKNFDSVGHSFIAVLQILTFDDWPVIVFLTGRALGGWAALYTVIIIVIGNFLLFNLFVAIVIEGLSNDGDIADPADPVQSSEETVTKSFSHRVSAFKASCVRMLCCCRSGAAATTSDTQSATDASTPDAMLSLGSMSMETLDRVTHINAPSLISRRPQLDRSLFIFSIDSRFRRFLLRVVFHPRFDHFILLCIIISSCSLAVERPVMSLNERFVLDMINLVFNAIFLLEALIKIVAMGFLTYIRSHWNKLDLLVVVSAVIDTSISFSTGASSSFRILRTLRIFRALRPLRLISRATGLRIVMLTLSHSLRPIVNTVAITLFCFAIFAILGMQLFGGALSSCSDVTIPMQQMCVGVAVDGTVRKWANRAVNFDNFLNAMVSVFSLASLDNWTDFLWDGVSSTGRTSALVEYANEAAALYFVLVIVLGAFFIVNIFVGVFVDAYHVSSDFVARGYLAFRRRAAAQRHGQVLAKLAEAKHAHELADMVGEDENGEVGARGVAPPVPGAFDMFRSIILDVVSHTWFDGFSALMILLNVITMMFETYRSSSWQIQFINITNYFFTLLFGVEAFFKLLASHPTRYFAEGWNIFDFFVVVVSFAGVLSDSSGVNVAINPTILRTLRIFRIFRILRAFRVLRATKGLQMVVTALLRSLPQIGNLFGMLVLEFFVFAVLGVEIFSQVCLVDDVRRQCAFVDPAVLVDSHAHFRDFGFALLTLFRIATADNWSPLMSSMSTTTTARVPDALAQARVAISQGNVTGVFALLGGCVSDAEVEALGLCDSSEPSCTGTCGQPVGAPIFFITFICLTSFIMLNLVVAVLMQQLSDVESSPASRISENVDSDMFFRLVAIWKKNAKAKLASGVNSAAHKEMEVRLWMTNRTMLAFVRAKRALKGLKAEMDELPTFHEIVEDSSSAGVGCKGDGDAGDLFPRRKDQRVDKDLTDFSSVSRGSGQPNFAVENESGVDANFVGVFRDLDANGGVSIVDGKSPIPTEMHEPPLAQA